MTNWQFIKDKFDALVITILFAAIIGVWIAQGYPQDLRDFVVGLFGAVLIVWGIRPRPNQTVNAENVTADTIDRATTQTGDIVAADIYSKGKPKDENSID